jgi:RNA polymerase sigma factor (sigma-70 family)
MEHMIHLHSFIEKEHEKIRQRWLGIAKVKLPTLEDAEDLVQETLMKLLNINQQFDSPDQVYLYISQTFYNLRTDFYRKRGSQGRGAGIAHLSDEFMHQIIPSNTVDILHKLTIEEILEIVSRAFKALSENCRRVFELLFEEEIDRKAIPGMLGISKEAFENRLFQCRKRLKEKVENII